MKNIDKGLGAVVSSIIGILIAVAVLSIAIPVYKTHQDNKMDSDVAYQMQSIASAYNNYITQNYTQILTSAKATAPQAIKIPLSQVINAGLLPQTTADTNQFLQQYEAIAAVDSKGNLNALLVTTGGTTLTKNQMLKIANDTKGGGYITGNKVTGSFDNWELPLSLFQTSIPDGHLAVNLSQRVFASHNAESDRLYRFKVNDNPDLNAMHTDINMDNNSLNNVNQVTANQLNGQYVYLSGVVTQNSSCPKIGLLARDSNGQVMNCLNVDGKTLWSPVSNKKAKYNIQKYTDDIEKTGSPFPLGKWDICLNVQTVWSQMFIDDDCDIANDNGIWYGDLSFAGTYTGGKEFKCLYDCFDF